MAEGMTCYERDEAFCEDQMCLRVGCRLQNERLSAERKMPARIWSGPELAAAKRTWGMHEYSKKINASVPYIRADLVEPLVEALRQIEREMRAGLGSSYGETREQVRRALAAYTALQSGQAQTEARG